MDEKLWARVKEAAIAWVAADETWTKDVLLRAKENTLYAADLSMVQASRDLWDVRERALDKLKEVARKIADPINREI